MGRRRIPVKTRRALVVLLVLIGVGILVLANPASYEKIFKPKKAENAETAQNLTAEQASSSQNGENNENAPLATEVLEKLAVKGRAPKTGYSREEFYKNWPDVNGCSLRQQIIRREFGDSAQLDGCDVISGEYDEPYTGEHKVFTEKEQISKGVQIDHVVALSDAWQKGAQNLTAEQRYQMATDPLNLLAVDSSANQKKSDGDAATWLPSNKPFRCQYVARQVSVKFKYTLWVTEAEKTAISGILSNCPEQRAIGVTL